MSSFLDSLDHITVITKDLKKCVQEIKFALSNNIIKDPSENTYYNHLIDFNK